MHAFILSQSDGQRQLGFSLVQERMDARVTCRSVKAGELADESEDSVAAMDQDWAGAVVGVERDPDQAAWDADLGPE